MLNFERQALIVEIAREKQLVKVAELMEKFGVSDMTIRRDLEALQQQGILKKVYGGAVLATTPVQGGRDAQNEDVSLDIRASAFADRKREIARRAVELIVPHDVIILDAGTTTLELAKILPRHEDVVIVTNSIAIAHELAGKTSSLLLAGGIVRESTHSTVGPKTKEFMSDLRANKLFLGASSLSLKQGLLNSNLYESEIKRTMMASADQVIVLADSSKFNNASYHVFARWENVDMLISDHHLPLDVQQSLREQGIEVITGTDPDESISD